MENGVDYQKIGFKCGLEIHQRLNTRTKLFCSCPASLSENEEITGRLTRYQRAVAGELGTVDVSAKFEGTKNRKFIYDVDGEHSCLVDLDEEPPHLLNGEALETALELAKAMKMVVVDEIQPMRKGVVDGSNPSAFQRTIKIGMDGKITVNGHDVNITSMFLEEESAGIERSDQGESVFNTDRIGIPLLEIDTDPYIRSPKEARDVALYIGTLLRISGRVQRGIGSIRQDVNVSISGGTRTEIKGLQDVASLDKYVENEIVRQKNLLALKDELNKRHAGIGKVSQFPNDKLKNTKAKIARVVLDSNGMIMGACLEGFAGLIGREVNPGRRLGTEISDYAKMGGVKGMIHSDENLSNYGFTDREIEELRKFYNVKKDDAFILIIGDEKTVQKAFNFAIERAQYAYSHGVVPETRAAMNNDECTTRFMRPLPGGSRMYPETDTTPVQISEKMLKDAEKKAPSIDKVRSRLSSELKNKSTVEQLMTSPRLHLYLEVSDRTNAEKDFVANTILQKFTELRRNGFEVESVEDDRLVDLFDAYASGELTKNGVEEALKELSKGNLSLGDVIKSRKLKRISGRKLQELVEKEFKGKRSADELVREVMSKYRINVDGEELNRLARSMLK
jgi:glutamyl-tRNA(Gln) amidotransferase subunit E